MPKWLRRLLDDYWAADLIVLASVVAGGVSGLVIAGAAVYAVATGCG